MKNTNKLFDKNLFWEGVSQTKLIGIIGLVIVLAITITEHFYIYALLLHNDIYGFEHFISTMLELCPALLFTIYIFIPIMTLYLFRFLNKRKSSDFYHSIAPKRETLLFSFAMSILFWAAITIISCVFIALCSAAAMHNYINLNYLSAIPFTLNLLAASFLMISGILIGACLSGRTGFAVVISFLILFLPRTLIAGFRLLISNAVSIINYDSFLPWLTNTKNSLIGACITGYTEYSSIVYTLILGLLYMIIAIILYKRRASETAEKSTINRPMQIIIRTLFTLIFCIPAIAFIYFSIRYSGCSKIANKIIIVAIYVTAIIVYFLFEIITQKGIATLLRAVKEFLIVIVANVLILVLLVLSTNYIYSFQPETNDIDSISVYCKPYFNFPSYNFLNHNQTFDYFYYQLSKIKFTDKEIIDEACVDLKTTIRLKDYENELSGGDQYVVTFYSGNSSKTRQFNISNADFINTLIKNKKCASLYKTLPEYKNNFNLIIYSNTYNEEFLTNKQKSHFYKLLKKDIKNIDTYYLLNYYNDYTTDNDDGFNPSILLTFFENNKYFKIDMPLNSKLPLSYAYITNLMCKALDNYDTSSTVLKLLDLNKTITCINVFSSYNGTDFKLYNLKQSKMSKLKNYLSSDDSLKKSKENNKLVKIVISYNSDENSNYSKDDDIYNTNIACDSFYMNEKTFNKFFVAAK